MNPSDSWAESSHLLWYRCPFLCPQKRIKNKAKGGSFLPQMSWGYRMRLPIILNSFFLNLKFPCYLRQTLGWAESCLLSMSSVEISTTNPPPGLSPWRQALSIINLDCEKRQAWMLFSGRSAAAQREGKHRRQVRPREKDGSRESEV